MLFSGAEGLPSAAEMQAEMRHYGGHHVLREVEIEAVLMGALAEMTI